MSKKGRNIAVIVVLSISLILTLVIVTSSITNTTTDSVEINSEDIYDIVSSELSESDTENSYVYTPEDFDFGNSEEPPKITRDPLYYDAEFKADSDTPSVDIDINVDAFDSEHAKQVVKQLAKELGYTQVNVFNKSTDYNNGLLTTSYYITFDNEKVYYVFEQEESAHILEDTYHTYNEVVTNLQNESTND